MKNNADGVSERVDALRRQGTGAHEGFAVMGGGAETHSSEDTDLEASTKSQGKSCIRVRAREGESGAGSLERGRSVSDAEEYVHKRSQAGVVAPFELWPGEEIEQPGVERRVLGNGSARGLGTGRCERDKTFITTEMGGEAAQDAEVFGQIAGEGDFKAAAAFIEIGVGGVEAGTKAEGVIVGFDG